MTVMRSTALAIVALIATAFAVAGRARTPPPSKGQAAPSSNSRPSLPPGMTQEQFDSLVNAITQSVLEKLKTEGVPAAGAPQPKPGLFAPGAQQGPDEFDVFLDRTATVMEAV